MKRTKATINTWSNAFSERLIEVLTSSHFNKLFLLFGCELDAEGIEAIPTAGRGGQLQMKHTKVRLTKSGRTSLFLEKDGVNNCRLKST
jgi:hypothetical protein